MNQFFEDLWEQMLGYYNDILDVFPKLLLAILTFLIILFLANRSQKYLNKRLLNRLDDALLAQFIARFVKILLVIVAIMIGLKIVGLTDIAAGLITGASVSALVVGFAFKDIGENLLAGIMLAFNRPFHVGDVVELDQFTGKVMSLNLRNTQIKTFDGKDIYIPNSTLVKSPVTNYTIDGFLRFDFLIKLDYAANTNRAIEITVDTLNNIPGILKGDKAPAAYLTETDSKHFHMVAYYWLNITDPNVSGLQVKSDALHNVVKNLNESGFNLPAEHIIELKNYQDQVLKVMNQG